MKKILSFFLVAAMILSLVACNTTGESAVSSSSPSSNSSLEGEQNAVESNLPEEPSSETSTEGSVSDGGESSHVLVAYFSWADNAILADDVDAVASPSVIPPGNVQQLAGWVQEETAAHPGQAGRWRYNRRKRTCRFPHPQTAAGQCCFGMPPSSSPHRRGPCPSGDFGRCRWQRCSRTDSGLAGPGPSGDRRRR